MFTERKQKFYVSFSTEQIFFKCIQLYSREFIATSTRTSWHSSSCIFMRVLRNNLKNVWFPNYARELYICKNNNDIIFFC